MRLSEGEAKFAADYAASYQEHIDKEGWAVCDTSRLPDALKQITQIHNLAQPPNLETLRRREADEQEKEAFRRRVQELEVS